MANSNNCQGCGVALAKKWQWCQSCVPLCADCGQGISRRATKCHGCSLRSEDTRRRMSEAHKGRKQSKETRRKRSQSLMGRPVSEETRRKISEALTGNSPSEETRLILSVIRKGMVPWIRGRKHTEETKRKMSEAAMGRKTGPLSKEHRRKLAESKIGEENPAWRGGVSQDMYPPEFNDALKLSIRERDGFTCQLCDDGENGRAHAVHHVDMDKQNVSDNNLVTLCNSCHRGKAHGPEADYYRVGLEALMWA